MKESITKFDLEAAFKALDEIDVPVAQSVRANRPALTEIFSRKSKFDSLMEEYYDINNAAELDDAKEAREAEVAKAKLARIEKIVDLDADSPEDLLTSYVGKYIIQCPQCMTLFYKNPEDVVEDEEDPSTVNVNEVCQHCGNEAGYTLIGKVGEAEPDEAENFDMDAIDIEEPATEETSEESEEATEASEETDDLEIDLDAINLDEEPEEEEKQEESFNTSEGETLMEELTEDPDLDAKLEAHNEYIEYLRNMIAQEEETLEKSTNKQVKAAIQRRIDAFKVDLENALPEAVKNDETTAEESAEEPAEELAVEEISAEAEEVVESLTESLHEEAEVEVSAEEFEELISSPEFKKPISDAEARAMINAEKDPEEEPPINESKSIYKCSDCGYETELEDEDFDGMCPKCKEHHGSFEKLEEGIFDKIKDKLTDKLTTRAAKADWVLKTAMIDYDKAVLTDKGDVEAKAENQKFTTFIVVGYKDQFANGKEITAAPEYNNKDLVVGLKHPEVKAKYADAEKIAKGWSMKSDCGPAFIYLAKNAEGDGAAFLCQYFNGELDAKSDQLVKYVTSIRKNLEGSKLMVKGGANQSDTKKVPAAQTKPGMKVLLKDGTTAEITKVENVESRLVDDQYNITVEYADGSPDTLPCASTSELNILREATTNKNFDTFMSTLEELQESSLETLISDSLVEAYGNVAGFRLTECSYLNEKLTVNGTVYFTSGNTRNLTYSFNEACVEEDKVKLRGLNEKLGLDKRFTLTGRIENKTLITESFSNK